MWDAAAGKELRTLEHVDFVGSVIFSPDGKTLASWGWDRTIRFWDVASGKPLLVLQTPSATRNSLCWSPDGRYLASGHENSTLLLWDRFGITSSPKPLSPEQAAELWTDLLADAPPRRYRAMGRLVHQPEQAVPLLKKCLRPAPQIDAAMIAAWIEQLDGETFETREQASKQLEEAGDRSNPS